MINDLINNWEDKNFKILEKPSRLLAKEESKHFGILLKYIY